LVDDDGNDKDLAFEEALGTIEGAVPFLDEESVLLADGILGDQRKKK
jgi:hypothetical protein